MIIVNTDSKMILKNLTFVTYINLYIILIIFYPLQGILLLEVKLFWDRVQVN